MYALPVQGLIDELGRLPGIGPKSAQRIAFHLLKGTREDAQRLSAAVAELLEVMRTYTNIAQILQQQGDLQKTAIERLADVRILPDQLPSATR